MHVPWNTASRSHCLLYFFEYLLHLGILFYEWKIKNTYLRRFSNVHFIQPRIKERAHKAHDWLFSFTTKMYIDGGAPKERRQAQTSPGSKVDKTPGRGRFSRHNGKENWKTAPKPHCTFKNRPNGGLPQGSKFSRKQAYKNRPIGGKPPNLVTLIWSHLCIQADSKGFAFLAVRGKGGHPVSKKDRKLGSKTYQF